MPRHLPLVHILVPKFYASDLAAAVTVPHRISVIDNQSDDEVARLCRDADAFVGLNLKATWLVRDAPRLKLVQTTGAGTDGIDLSVLPAGCTVCNVYCHEQAVAEYTFMMMGALSKGLIAMDSRFRKGDWGWENRFVPELRGRNLLLLGFGHIGRELARWGRFIGMKVRAVTRSPSQDRKERSELEEIGGFEELPAFLPGADFIVAALPATPETIGLLGPQELAAIKPDAYLINVGRATVVDEEALYQALRQKRIAGAALDVWYRYPNPGEDLLPSRFPFHELENVIMTPHKGALTRELMQQRWISIAENIRRLAEGEPLLNVVHAPRTI